MLLKLVTSLYGREWEKKEALSGGSDEKWGGDVIFVSSGFHYYAVTGHNSFYDNNVFWWLRKRDIKAELLTRKMCYSLKVA